MMSICNRRLAFFVFLLLVLCMMTAFAETPFSVDYDTFSEAELLSTYEAVTKQLEQLGYRFAIERGEPEGDKVVDVASGDAFTEDVSATFSVATETEQYAKALELERNGNYEESLALFAKLSDYQDARERAHTNAALQAQVLFDMKDYKACQQLLLQYPSESTSELLSKCNDQTFLIDLAAALSARWDNSNKDTTLMSNKQLIEYLTSLVNSELAHIAKYSELDFSDPHLKEYANNYLGALQSQHTGITEYYGKDDKAYDEYWAEYGYKKRSIAVYWLNKKYGVELDSKYEDTFKDFVMDGLYCDEINTIRNMLEKQLYATDYTIKKKSGDNSAELSSFEIINTSRYTIESINIKVQYYDVLGAKVADRSLYYNYNGVNTGSVMVTDPAWIYQDFFDSLVFDYQFTVSDSRYSDTITGTVKPKIQYRWDGNIARDGTVIGGPEVIELEGIESGWETKYSLYVPYLKFSVKNSGTVDADRIVVKIVYINNETNEVWDTDTSYVIGFSDIPLKSGYSKKVFSYASVGLKSKLTASHLPTLSAEVYINDELFLTEIINK